MPKRGPGRPTKCTRQVIEAVCQHIRDGNHFHVSAQAAGISRGAFYDWKARGEADRESGESTIFAEFLDAVERAEAEAELTAVATIRTASLSAQHWTAAAWLLERRFGERWIKRSETEPTEIRVVVVDEGAETDATEAAGLAAARERIAAAVSAGQDILDRHGQTGRENGRLGPGRGPK